MMQNFLTGIVCGLFLLETSCGDLQDGVFAKQEKSAATTEQKADNKKPDKKKSDDADAEGDDVGVIDWPRGTIENENDFIHGIPKGDLAVKFVVEGDSLDDFEIRCRCASTEKIDKEEKKTCKDKWDVKGFEKKQPYRFELYAIHKDSKEEKLIASSNFRTDPIEIISPEEALFAVQYSGIIYVHLRVTSIHQVYFTCSTVSDLVWDPTMECRNGVLILDLARFTGVQRLRVMAWDLRTNKLLAERPLFFCSGFLCPRTIGFGSPPPYGGPPK